MAVLFTASQYFLEMISGDFTVVPNTKITIPELFQKNLAEMLTTSRFEDQAAL